MFAWVTAISKGQGANDALAQILATVTAYETANYTSNVFRKNKNLGGVMWLNNLRVQNATKGLPFPKRETKAKQYYYANYPTINAAIMDYLRVMKRVFNYNGKFFFAPRAGYSNKLTKQDFINAATLMKRKGYFTDNTDRYAANLYNVYLQYIDAVKPINKANAEAKKERERIQQDTVKDAAIVVANRKERETERTRPFTEGWGVKEWGLIIGGTAALILLSRK